MEDQLARPADRVLFCDTGVLATSMWHQPYLHTASAQLQRAVAARRHDLYRMTDIDVPFVQDGFRDGESIRPGMSGRFEQVLAERNLSWAKISGWGRQRFDRAQEVVDNGLSDRRSVASISDRAVLPKVTCGPGFANPQCCLTRCTLTQ
jgi:HTH-type transcriptional regulator, transcriptional repressor of NAD biosynthesis genes